MAGPAVRQKTARPFLILILALILVLVSLPVLAQFASSLKVSKIEIVHVGPPSVSDDLIRANIRLKPGDPYLSAAVDDDIHTLYATGQFYDVRVTNNVTPEGIGVYYVLQGNPRLTTIKFQGNKKYSDAKLKKKISAKTGEPLSERKLFTDSQTIQQMYQKAGYPGTTVTYSISIDEAAGRATATFNINESPKVRIIRVDFVGAQAFTQRKLRRVIKTRKHWFFSWITSSGVFKEDQFEDDKDKLADFYHSQGYIDFEIKDVQFEHPTPRTLIIRIIVYEGRQYKVGSVKFTGNKIFTDAQIAEGILSIQPSGGLAKKIRLGPHGLPMDTGDTFTPDGLNTNMQMIADFYGSRGYIDVAPFSPGLNVERIPNTDTGTMDLNFQIDEGQKNFIEKIDIRGNTKTKDRVIRRELAVAPGEVFNMLRVKVSQRRLEGLQYFDKVDLRPEPSEANIPNHKDLVVGVEEKNTGNLTMGAGFDSVESLVGFVEVTQGNFDLFNPPTFTGAGQKFRLKVQLGLELQDYEAEFIEPWFLGRKLKLDVDLYRHDYNFESLNNLYDQIQTGGRVGLSRALGSDYLIGGVGYTLEDVGILLNGSSGRTNAAVPIAGTPQNIPQTIIKDSGYAVVSKVDVSLSYDTRNSVTLPDKGQVTTLSGILAGPFPGSRDYYKLQLKSAWYFKGLFPGHVLEVIGETGVADSYGSSSDVPFYDRYYLGGLYSLRGFHYRSVSPRELPPQPGQAGFSDEPIGGDTYWFGSAEYSVPIIQSPKENGVGLRFAVFYDIGEVSLDPYSYNADYLDNWGVGLRLNLPIGPLRLDYGIPIRTDRFNSSSGQFQFGVGFTRPF